MTPCIPNVTTEINQHSFFPDQRFSRLMLASVKMQQINFRVFTVFDYITKQAAHSKIALNKFVYIWLSVLSDTVE